MNNNFHYDIDSYFYNIEYNNTSESDSDVGFLYCIYNKMFDIYGKRLRIQPAITNSINISFIPQGMYLILINFSDNKSVTKKYIKH